MEKERDNSQRGKYLVFGEGLFGEGKLIVPSTRPGGQLCKRLAGPIIPFMVCEDRI